MYEVIDKRVVLAEEIVSRVRLVKKALSYQELF
jgi:hypothetical protein